MSSQFKVLTLGSALSELDIFLNFQGSPIQASGVSWDVYDSSSVLTVSGSGINTAQGKYTASGTVPTGFQLGNWEIQWDVTLQDGTIVEATETFCVQSPSVSIGFTPPTDKTASIYSAVQLDVGDPDGSIFNENYLQRVLIKAVRRLNQKLGTAVTFRGPVGVPGGFGGRRIRVIELDVDVEAGTITPNNAEVCDLVILQMEYIIMTSELNALKRLHVSSTSGPHVGMVTSAINDDVKVQNADGVTVEIGGGRLQTRASLFRFSVEEARRELEMAVRAFLNRLTGNFGKMIY